MGEMDAEQRGRFGRHIMNWYAESLERALAARRHIPAEQVFDYAFRDFVSDPKLATVDEAWPREAHPTALTHLGSGDRFETLPFR